jgi:Ca-activated chloride channel family protein
MGTIEEATLSVSPKGLFMEYGLYLTFSARITNFNQNDSVEVVLDFELPQNAIVTDSWLWIGEDISKAIIMDRWSASSIYEDIVRSLKAYKRERNSK